MAEALDFNFDEFLRGLQDAEKEVIDAAVHAVDEFGEQLIGNAQELTPIETGALQASGTATDAKVGDRRSARTSGSTSTTRRPDTSPPGAGRPAEDQPQGPVEVPGEGDAATGPEVRAARGHRGPERDGRRRVADRWRWT
jgi:hypothetical protein